MKTFNWAVLVIFMMAVIMTGMYTNWIIAAIALIGSLFVADYIYLPITYKRTTISDSIKEIVLRRQNYTCANCPRTSLLEFHHKLPVCEGGTNHPDNLVALCPVHHAAITRFKN